MTDEHKPQTMAELLAKIREPLPGLHPLPPAIADLDPDDYACPYCHDSGYTRAGSPGLPISDPLFGKSAPCQHCDVVLPRLAPGLPWAAEERYALTNLDQSPEIRRRLGAWIDGASANRPFLVIHGPVGTGKTHVARAVCFVMARARRRVMFTTAKDLLGSIKRTFADGAELDAEQVVTYFAQAQVLCLDDLGAENETAWAQSEILDVVDRRYSAATPTIITTNMRPTDRLASGRLWSRVFGELTLRLPLIGQDRRRQAQPAVEEGTA